MKRPDAAAALAAQLRAEISSSSTAPVFDYPPAIGSAPSPHVAVVYQGATGTEFVFGVQVVANASLPNGEVSYRDWLTLVELVDDALDAGSYGPPGDDASYNAQLDAWVSVASINYPRTDF